MANKQKIKLYKIFKLVLKLIKRNFLNYKTYPDE